MKLPLKSISLLCILLGYGECAKILGIFQLFSYSHYQMGLKLLKSLNERGHQVTMISSYKLDPPPENWRNIHLKDLMKDFRRDKEDLYELAIASSYLKVMITATHCSLVTSESFNYPQVQELIHSNESFDLIIMEKFYNEAMLGYVHKFKVPYILLSTIGSSRWINEIVGNPGSPAYIPDLFLNYTPNMNFWQRLYNTIFYIFAHTYKHLIELPKQQALMDKYFPGAKLENLYYNASLVLLNSHLSIHPPFPSVPNMIDIGGYHIDPPKRLPQDLQNFLDKSTDGVIYFSLGSILRIKIVPESTINSLLKIFSKLKQKVLWKWDSETLPKHSPNIKLEKWFPQQDILAHPNIVLFITHCGLLSTIEAVHYGVPLLAMPVFGDQLMNAAVVEENGYGLSTSFVNFNEKVFATYLNELLTNSRYKKNVKIRSKILKDQENTPLERALFWVEYVIRHKGAPHLKSVTLNLQWYQYLLLDVVAFIILVVLTLVASVAFCIKRLRSDRKLSTKSTKKLE